MDTSTSSSRLAGGWIRIAGGVLLALLAGTATSSAQFEACKDTMNLRSPTGLEVEFERTPVLGNRILWDPQDPSESGCFRLDVPAATEARIHPIATGAYVDIFDRKIKFTVPVGSGVVGDPSQDVLRVSVDGLSAYEAVPSLSGRFNLSNTGGMFRVDLVNDVAVQSNGPTNEVPSAAHRIPPHLETTNVTALGKWRSPDGTQARVYAAIEGLPLMRSDDGARTWRETASKGVDPIGRRVDVMAVSPSDPDRVFLGTANRGLWRTLDGGVTFERADRSVTTASPAITALTYLEVDDGAGGTKDRLFMAGAGIGLFYTDDDGDTWTRVTELRPPKKLEGKFCDNDAVPRDSSVAALRVRSMAVSSSGRVYAGLQDWGVYRSDDAGGTWERANGGLVLCFNVEPPEGRPATVERILVLRQQKNPGQDYVLASTSFNGVFYSVDGGDNWVAGTDWPYDELEDGTKVYYRATALKQDPFDETVIYAATATHGLIESTDEGRTWGPWDTQQPILTSRLADMIFLPDADPRDKDVLLVSTVGGGVYLPGTDIDISRAIVGSLPPPPGSTDALRIPVDLGIRLRFSAGPIDTTDSFTLYGQSVQGYVVWRASRRNESTGEPDWELIGLYDITNPEYCYSGSCDESNPQHIPGCFADKRANCFGYDEARGKIYFFDRNIQNGFTYDYAVSTFDYGYLGETSPTSFAGEMLFSPRSAVESSVQAEPFTGEFAQEADVTVSATVDDLTPQTGKAVTVQVTIDDRGPQTAENVRVQVEAPAGMTFDVGSVSGPGTYDGSIWALPSLGKGQQAVLQIPATYQTDGPVLLETAFVGSNLPDPDPNNDRADVRMAAGRADLELTQSLSVTSQFVGQPVGIQLQVTNHGPDSVAGARILVGTSSGLRFDTVSAAPDRYADGIWSPEPIDAGQSRTLTIEAVVLRGGTVSSTATILYADPADPQPANDRAAVDLRGMNYNQLTFQVNVGAATSLDDVFVVPNPLRGQAGWDSGDQASIRFVNVTPGSKCEIYTLAGDLVRTLSNTVTDGEERGNIQWDTRNEAGSEVASGVYIFRITNDQGSEVISRFTIIR